jgi:toxin HigB-1
VIRSFRCRDSEKLHHRERVLRFASVEQIARRKLRQLDSAAELRDLASPPGRRLEAFKGERRGQYRIRINDQWDLLPLEWHRRV